MKKLSDLIGLDVKEGDMKMFMDLGVAAVVSVGLLNLCELALRGYSFVGGAV